MSIKSPIKGFFYIFFLCFACTEFPILSANELLEESQGVQFVLPGCPYSSDALGITTKNRFFIQWNEAEHLEAYRVQRAVAEVWKESGVHQYLNIGKNDFQSDETYTWQIIPFSDQKTSAVIKQIQVIKKVLFGGGCESHESLHDKKNELTPFLHAYDKMQQHLLLPSTQNEISDDAFCNPEVIAKQRIIEGDLVNVLYHYAPTEKLAFMVVSKAHRATFLDLTPEEYLEAQMMTKRLLEYFHEQGYDTAYIFHKSGRQAGQTVAHWHQHVIIPEKDRSNFRLFIRFLQNLIISPSRLSTEELQKRVDYFKSKL